jgi:hypothetical protein
MALSQQADPGHVRALLDQLHSQRGFEAAVALDRFGPQQQDAVPYLVQALKDKDAFVAEIAAKTLSAKSAPVRSPRFQYSSRRCKPKMPRCMKRQTALWNRSVAKPRSLLIANRDTMATLSAEMKTGFLPRADLVDRPRELILTATSKFSPADHKRMCRDAFATAHGWRERDPERAPAST